MKTSRTLSAAFLIAGSLFTAHAFALANLGISPTQVDLSPAAKTGEFTLMNNDDKPVNLQMSAKSWDMDETGKFIETDTGDFVFYPKTITIPAKAQAMIRAGYTGTFPNTEKPYRIIIEEVPNITPDDVAKSKVKVGLTPVLHLSIPVYVIPESVAPSAQVELGGLKTDKNSLRVGVKNLTGYHVNLNKVAVKLFKKDSLVTEKAVDLQLQRILGGRMVFIDLPMDVKKSCAQADAIEVKIEAKGLKEPYQTKMPLKPDCTLSQ